ncbi:MAG: N-acetylornithine carbamoyltransferase [Candidatus Lokiarchaeota archaeon]|nr:N-acetylornithine carbamoyltransferase [Candidatus Lokiarchaeota archaeon]MBD3342686.1 N-acetylornithine carbamoyltransferase [Candidatus Lokiarchaeota archaeon]
MQKKQKLDFISTQDWKKENLDELLELTKNVKENPKKYFQSLLGKSLCMFFYNPSTRTRNSTEVAAYQLGIHAAFNSIKDSWIGYQSESVKDTASVLARYYNALAIRLFPVSVNWVYKEANRILREFAKWSEVPVINFEDDQFHPLQALTDIFTIIEKKKNPKGKKFVLTWAYHPKPLPLSVPNSTLLISTRYGMDVTLAHPEGYELDDEIVNLAKDNARKSGGSLDITHDIKDAYQDADVVYVKSWGAISHYGDAREEKPLRLPYRDKWRIQEDYLKYTDQDSILMHCLPIRRNIVADDAVVDGKHSIVYDQAENRLYTIKALLYYLLKE